MAKTTRTFKMNGKTYSSMMEIARELGKKRIQPKDFQKYGIEEVTDTDQAAAEKKEVSKKPVPAEETKKEVAEKKAPVKKAAKNLEKKEKSSKPAITLDELSKLPLETFSKNLKKISTDSVIQFAADNGVDTADEATDERIRRMRVVMNLKAKFYPGQSLEPKKVSFKGVELEKLLKFADEQGVEYRHASEEKIQKMWVIYALNCAGFYDLPQEKDEKGAAVED